MWGIIRCSVGIRVIDIITLLMRKGTAVVIFVGEVDLGVRREDRGECGVG